MLDIQISNIKLKPDTVLLEAINLEIAANSVFTIIGKNGAGKTTLVKALTSLLDPGIYSIEGSVLFNGKNILTISKDKLLAIRKNNIKYVFQDAINSFDPLKTFKFYFERLAKDTKETETLLDFFILPKFDELKKLYPYEVSGGMAQRISFILALLSKPEIIILDEPTSGIDSAIANLFIKKIKEFSKINNNAVLLVTHDFLFAQKVSNKIAFITDKKLNGFTSPGKFLEKNDNLEINDLLSSYKQIIL